MASFNKFDHKLQRWAVLPAIFSTILEWSPLYYSRGKNYTQTHKHTWWRHQMETFSALLATGPRWIPTQRPVTRSFDVFFDLRLNKRLSKQPWGWWFETLSRPLWRHRNDMNMYHRLWCMIGLLVSLKIQILLGMFVYLTVDRIWFIIILLPDKIVSLNRYVIIMFRIFLSCSRLS